MKNRALDARRYKFVATDQVLPDANVWLYINGPAAATGSWAVSAYAAVLAKVLTAQTQLFLDVLVLGEFVNRYARMEYRRLNTADPRTGRPFYAEFKDFRRSSSFLPVASAIANEATNIVNICKRVDHLFSQWNAVDLLHEYSTGAFDCSDQLLVESCRKHGFALLTNDGDFTEGGLTVFTANNRLLKACPC
jgi:predicted nucleic acid-binding protein